MATDFRRRLPLIAILSTVTGCALWGLAAVVVLVPDVERQQLRRQLEHARRFVPEQTVVVARRTIQPGEVVSAGMLHLARVPAEVHGGASLDQVVGRTTTGVILEGEVVRTERFSDPER